MIDIYAINLNQNGEINSDKVLIQDVPATNGIHISEPSVKIGIESSGSFSFSIQPDDEFYNQFMQLKTIIMVEYDEEVIFYGRVLTVDNGFFGEQKISCEGAISLLLDSYYPPKAEKERTPILISKYLRSVINNHNDMVDPDDTKKFYCGEVPGNYSNTIQNDQKITDEEYAFGTSTWTQTKSILDDLKSYYGGCWRTRCEVDTFPDIGRYGLGNIDLNNRPVVHNSDGTVSTELSFSVSIGNQEVLLPSIINGQIYSEESAISHYNIFGEYLGKFNTVEEAEKYAKRLHERQDWYYNGAEYYRTYLDWLDQYFDESVNTQAIEIGQNLITASRSTEVDNIFTRIIPVGKKDNKDVYLTGYSVSTITGGTWTFSDNWFDIKDLTKVYTDEQLSTGYHTVDDYTESQERYGIIWKIVSFDDMDTPEKLFNAAVKWAKDNFHGSIESFSVTAIDMHMTNDSIMKIHVGDRVNLRFPFGRGTTPPIITKLLTCLEIDYDLYNPENTSFRFGIPSMALTKNRRSSGKSTTKNASYSGYTPPKDETPETNDYDKWFDQVRSWLRSNKVWYNHNVPDHKQGGPTLTDSAGQTHPPYFWVFDPQMGSDGRGKILFWSPVITGIDSHGNITWGVDSQGRSRGSWLLREYSELNDTLLKNHHIYDYVIYEYGLDLRTGLSIKMPAVTTDEEGNLSIFSGIFSGEGGGLIDSPVVKKIAEFLGVDQVLNIFNSDGMNIAKILGEDGTYLFAELDDQGNVKTDDQGNPVYINIRDIHHSTQDLASELEATGLKVDLLDGDVTLIGQTLGDNTYGLIKTVADQGNTIASISDDVVLIGQELDQSVADLTADIAALGQTVTNINSDVTIIGQKVGDNTSGLIKDLADTNATVAAISTDVIALGGDMTQAQADIARNGQSITAINSDILSITSEIRAEITDAENNLYNYINVTASGTWQRVVDYTNRTWIQDYDPTTGSEPADAKEGDIWVESTLQGTWEGAEGFNWEHDQDYDWSKVQGAKIWVRKNNKWQLASDQQQVVTYSDVVDTAEHYVNMKIAGIVNDEGLMDIYMAKIEQTATEIRLEVNAADSTLYSFINQTASNIRSEVGNQIDGVTSSIEQTAASIRAEVNASNSEVYSFVEQTASYIRSEVGDAVSDVFSAIIQTASSIRAEVSASNSEVYSFVEQTASYIRSEVGDAVSDVYSSIEQTAASIRAEVNASDSEIYSFVEQTASYIRSEVGNSLSDVQSSITQTAESIRSEVDASNSQVYSAIEQTASSIKSEVGNSLSGVYSSISQTAESIRSDVSASNSEVYSAIEQTASSIRTDLGNSLSGIYSSITQTAESIRADISASNSEVYSAIEQTASSIKSEVGNSLSSVYSSISQTAESIRSDISASNSEVYSAIEQTASSIMSEVGNSLSSVYSSISQTAESIRADISASDSAVYSAIEQTASSIKSEVGNSLSSVYSSISQTAESIRSDISASNSEVYSAIEQTASSIMSEVGNSLSSVYSSISQTANAIRSEVNAADSDIYSAIEQSASQIRTEIVNSESGLYNYVLQTASGTRQYILSTTNRTWVQDTDPTTPEGGNNVAKEGDIWIESTSQGTWEGAEGFNWEHDGQYDWTQIQGAKVWAWKNNKWELAADQQQLVTYTDVIDTAEHYSRMMFEEFVNDGIIDELGSRIDQTARAILLEVFTSDSEIYSAIEQTASYIRAEVANELEDVGSTIEQTATQIRAEVHASSSQVYSFVEQTASYIRSEVGNELEDVYSSITQTANSIRSEVHAADSQVYSAIEQTASYIRSDVGSSLSGVYSSITQTVNNIRSEVHAADSQLYSAIEQSVSGISLQVANKPSVARSKTAPTSIDDRGLKDNDIWIESENQDSWDAIYDANISWNDESQIEWNKLRSDNIWVYRNGQWVQVLDGVNLVNDADIKLTENSIRMFARKLEQVNGEKEAYYAELKIDADRIRSEVLEKYKGLSSFITQTATQIRSEVTDRYNGLSSSITQTATQIRSEVNAANSQIYSSITQTASQIKSEVGNDISGLRSSITQNSNKIALVVEGTGSNAHINPASIVAAINAQTGTSTVRIESDKVYISGTTKINDIFGVNSSGFLTVNGDIYQNGRLYPTGVSLAEGGTVGFIVGTAPPVSVSLSGSDVQYMIKKAEVDGNTLKLWARGDPANTPSITFSKATTLTPSWSGSVLTMAATQTNSGTTTTVASKTIGFGGSYGDHDIELGVDMNGTASVYADTRIDVPIKVLQQQGGGATTSRYTKNVRCSLSSLLATTTIYANGTYTPPANNIGFSSVTVDVPSSTGSWSWNSQGFVDNTNNLPSGTKHQVNNLKNAIVSNRSSQGYIYFRILINGAYHVFYFADNGNGWTS